MLFSLLLVMSLRLVLLFGLVLAASTIARRVAIIRSLWRSVIAIVKLAFLLLRFVHLVAGLLLRADEIHQFTLQRLGIKRFGSLYSLRHSRILILVMVFFRLWSAQPKIKCEDVRIRENLNLGQNPEIFENYP